MQKSVFAGVAAAQQLHAPALLESVRSAFVTGMDRMLPACGLVTAASVVLSLVFLPGATRTRAPQLREESRSG